MFARVLVPFDGSPLSDAALRLAISIAQVEKSELVIAHAADARMIYGSFASATNPSDPGPALDALRAEGEAVLAKARAVAIAAGIKAKTHMMYSSPANLVLALAEAGGADLIVMGTHGRRGFARALLGSTTEGVLRASAIPVLAVRVPFAPATTTWPVSRVFAAVDDSGPAEAAAGIATELAKRTRGRLVLCDAAQSTALSEAGTTTKSTLERLAEAATSAGVATQRLAPSASPAEAILRGAEAAQAEMIVIGSHAEPGFHRILGTVAEAVVRDSLIPVLVVPQSGAAADAALEAQSASENPLEAAS